MSDGDNEPDVPPLRAIKAKDFQRYISELKLEKPCELCGAEQWHIAAEGEDADLPVVGFSDADVRRFYPVYPMYCGNCGNTKTFLANIVDGWVAKNG